VIRRPDDASRTPFALRSFALAAFVFSTGFAAQGCDTEAYCFACDEANTKGGAGGSTAGSAGRGGTSIGGAAGSLPMEQGGSAGSIGIDPECGDLQNDAANCGACGNVCERSGSFAKCVKGACEFTCAPGFADNDKDEKNGCEYACLASATEELCNGLDDDCDGTVDGPGVCSTDQSCGNFGKACIFAHSTGLCQDGVCVVGTCNPGFYPDKKNPEKNCDYACKETNGGVEVCDQKDNDCDGEIDEDPDVSADPLHCGACDKSCIGVIPNAAPSCQAGQCVLGACADGYLDKDGDPANGCEYTCKATCNYPFATGVCQVDGSCNFGTCLLGHYDLDKDPSNGCEYGCAISNSGVELCDGLDNDCNGVVDDTFDPQTDAKNCGGCGIDCSAYFPGSNVACTAGACGFLSCLPGYVDTDGSTANGCEYVCDKTNGGVEICDGKDNDCNGLIDDAATDVGGTCSTGLLGACSAGVFACSNGSVTCVSTTPPAPEVCDGKDNDCNGTVDDGTLPEVGFACGSSQVGACKFGTTSCTSGAITCNGAVGPKTETCNGVDDDCDGVVDDAVTGANAACGSAVGACVAGKNTCINGAFQCVGAIGAQASEICNGAANGTGAIDENCNGSSDEGCSFPNGAPVRLDTTGSTQGQHSTFQLAGAQAGEDAIVAYTDQRAGNPNIYVATSTNGGGSWSAADVGVATSGNNEVEPSPFLRKGKAYVAYSNFEGNDIRRIYVTSSTNATYTAWGAGVRITNPASGIDCYSPKGVVANTGTNDTLAVLWSEIGGTATVPTRNIKVAISKDGGATWPTVLAVNTGAGVNKGELPTIASDGAGMVYIAWRDKRVTGLAQAWFARIDTTVATPVIASATALQPNVASASATQITLAVSGSNVHVGWVDLRGAGTTIRVASSTDKGATFRKVAGVVDGFVVDPDAVQSDAVQPSLAARGDTIVAVWADERSGRNDIRANRSTDAGATWALTTSRVDTGDGAGATESGFPQVALGANNKVFVTWQDARFLPTAILANVSLDNGVTWHPDAGAAYRMDIDSGSPATGAAADSQAPLMFASPTTSAAGTVWIDFRGATGANTVIGDVWSRKFQ
jgi:hypothetical protein